MRDYSRTELTEAIDEWILNQKYRSILKSRLIDGLTYESLAELYDMSVTQVKRIVYKGREKIFRHLK